MIKGHKKTYINTFEGYVIYEREGILGIHNRFDYVMDILGSPLIPHDNTVNYRYLGTGRTYSEEITITSGTLVDKGEEIRNGNKGREIGNIDGESDILPPPHSPPTFPLLLSSLNPMVL